ncbi:sulfate ABC transporter, periplasmic sulfate- binding protein [Pirellula staleyi DSM 6068]|uniref:Sulfate ABC transporter, periplasmic sulfate-binding protein n=1 Tax=Pirellula staleyi (strain ATCC 27377 / DSM 6068 / ICPB 4128) TaxID=530564 RepID=D2R4F0_PIRSD|nr:sulfate ABC transporter substrate-binding protein [Pirellula staleyi]ADB15298.1 sulfate ABC transporter, periplasmic sulfate- binding protein [Pirellula staleyi DSM 6068]
MSTPLSRRDALRHVAYSAASCAALWSLTLAGCGSSTGETSGQAAGDQKPAVTLLNVSYDPTREFYDDFNASFSAYWLEKHGQAVTIDQSHGGSGKQARAVIEGLEADVVTLALAYDIDALAKQGQLIEADWQSNLPHDSAPYTSTIVFLVRKGNPKQIKDWSDLVKGDLQIITPNPKTSGGARWNYLAAWGYVLKQELGDLKKLSDPKAAEEVKAAHAKARLFVAKIFKRVPVLDSGARGATNTFVQRGLGDVLLAWENEAFLAVKELGPDQFEIVVPSVSILAQPPVTVVSKYAEKHGTQEIAAAYLQHLYSPNGQQLAAKHFYRPALKELISEAERKQFADVELFSIKEAFETWEKAQKEHFDDGGVFDQLYQPQ